MTTKDRVNILLVDDQPAKLLSYEVILAELDENLIKASSGSEALGHLLRTEIAVVLVDVCMPDLDGFELARMIREHPRLTDTPIILISAVFMTDLDRLKGYHSGAVDYVPVPIIPEVLRAKVRVFAELHRKTEQLRRLNAELEQRVAQRTAALQESAEQLRVNEQRFRLALTASPISVCCHDLELRYTWLHNPPPGYAIDTAIGRRDDELHPPVAVAELVALKQSVLAAGVGERRQLRTLIGGEARILDVVAEPLCDAAGTVVGLRVAASDITPIQAAEQALRKSEEQFRFLADTIPSLIWTATPDGRITYANRPWQEYSGITAGDHGEHWPDLQVHPEDQERWRTQWAEHRQHGSVFAIEVRNRRHDGVYRWFLTRAVPRHDAGGQIVAWFGVSTDIHEQKLMQDQLREADRRKDEFLAVLAHELRNPLSPILNAVNVLSAATIEHPDHVWCRDVIRRQVEHLTRLVDDLLDVSRITRGKVKLQRKTVELGAVIARAVEATRPLIDDHGHRLQVSVAEQSLRVDGDLLRLAQVVGNILNNAAKYTPDGGTIELSAGREGGCDGTELAVIRVRDRGVGIPPAMLPRIFDLFVQVDLGGDHAQGGLGIGLALVRNLIELHGGTVEAHSEGIGRGSELVVRLPLSSKPCEAEPATRSGASKPHADRHLVLVADDNADSAESLAMLLRLSGHRVHTVRDGAEALAAAEAMRPNVILLDVGMPNMDGYEAARRIRALPWGRDVLLIAQTGWGQEQDRRRSSEAGFDAHLTKPLDATLLLHLLAQGVATVSGNRAR